MPLPELIDTPAALADFCAAARSSAFIAFDTEYLQDKHYYSRLCLIQVATEAVAVAIDPLAFGIDGWPKGNAPLIGSAPELNPFWELLADAALPKVLHAGSNDLEICYRLTGQVPAPIFDTQVAAMACGYSEQISYQRLVEGICRKRVAKSARLYHWDKRPLDPRQLSYALDDVIYLREIYRYLSDQLDKRNRRSWVEEELARLTDPRLYARTPEDAWKTLRSRDVDEGNFSLVKALCTWREIQAQRKNLPRRYVLADIDLLRIASRKPQQLITNFPTDINLGKQLKADLLAFLQQLPEPLAPEKPPQETGELAPHSQVLLELLVLLLGLRAAEQGVAERLIASRDDLRELILQGPEGNSPLLRGWRAEVFGRDALRLLRGQAAFTVVERPPTKREQFPRYQVQLIDLPAPVGEEETHAK